MSQQLLSYIRMLWLLIIVTSDDCTFMGFDEKPSKKWVKSTNEEINVLLTEYTEREQLIKILSNLLRK